MDGAFLPDMENSDLISLSGGLESLRNRRFLCFGARIAAARTDNLQGGFPWRWANGLGGSGPDRRELVSGVERDVWRGILWRSSNGRNFRHMRHLCDSCGARHADPTGTKSVTARTSPSPIFASLKPVTRLNGGRPHFYRGGTAEQAH